MSSGGIFTPEEQEILDRTKKVRIDIVDSMVKDGVPEAVGSIRVLNEILGGLDSMVQDSASNRLKHQDNANNEATKDLVAEMIKQTAIDRSKQALIVIKPELETQYIPEDTDVVDGELEINPTALDPNDFTS